MQRSEELPQVILVQWGSRHRYAIPQFLEASGMLCAFYTDAHARSPLGRAAHLFPARWGIEVVENLKKRTVTGIDYRKIRTYDSWVLSQRLLSRRGGDPGNWLRKRDEGWGKKLMQWGVDGADIVYSMSGENLSFLQFAKRKGKKVVVDAYISPLTYRVGKANKLRVKAPMSEAEIHSKSMEDYHAEIYDIADVVLCPSNWVAEGVRAVCPSAGNKIALCPYGSSLAFQETAASQRQSGRVLWAGREWFRKGLHDLAAAAEQLKPRFPHMDFRVAGLSEKEVSGHIKPGSLTYLGMLDRERMAEEFRRAEMFVLPSYSEGMASVVVEAIAAGCPVIITHETGIDGISDQKNGMLVAAGDPQALRVAIEKIHLDQDLREKIFLNSRELAQEYSSSTWKARLTSVLSSI